MSQPFDCFAHHPARGKLDEAAGEFWMENPWDPKGHNLSAYERNRVLLNTGRGTFLDVSGVSGADSDSDARSVVSGDFNNDGMMDLVVRNCGGGPVLVLENRWPKRHWLKVSLRGRTSNSLGIGAKLSVEAGGRTLHRELFPNNSYMSQNPAIVHFGLGEAERVDRLAIRWPSGVEQVLGDLPADVHLRIREGDEEYEVVGAAPARP